jgi:heme/copper-type cytochrome/quinol oxidase subunit 2
MEAAVTGNRASLVRLPALAVLSGLTLAVVSANAVVAQSRRDFSVSARKYSYKISSGGSDVQEIRVQLDDMVTITFSAEDIAHSFTVGDPYRLDRRAEPGKPVTIRFRADKAGTFQIRCNLSLDDRCLREMKGTLIVEGKR